MRNVSDSNNLISLESVGKTYADGGGPVLHDISLSVREGQFLCLIGASGCGKTTLLKIIAGLETASSGTVQLPKETSMGFQNGALLPWRTVADNVTLGLDSRGITGEKAHRIAREYLALLGLSDFAGKYPRELSGGQRQRVGIARALAIKPSVLLLDEPFSALDPKTTNELHLDLLKIWRETHLTIVMVSHLIEEAVALAETVVLMESGGIKETFPIDISYPRHEQGEAMLHEIQKVRRAFFAS